MRETAKQLARLIAAALVLPAVASYCVRARLLGADRALEGSSHWLSLLPGLAGAYLRTAFYRFALAECHPSARIEFGVLFSKAGARIGENAYIGPRCHIGLAHIERDVLIAAGVHIPSGARIHGTADPDLPIREQPGEIAQVTIGAGAWLGAGSIVMADVGPHSIIGAGSVVTRPIAPHVIAAGAPACLVKSRPSRSDAYSREMDRRINAVSTTHVSVLEETRVYS